MNREYILSKVKPYLDSQNCISEEDFKSVFSILNKTQQYKVIDILIEEGIDIAYDGPKVKATKSLHNPKPLATVSQINKLTNEQLCLLYQQGNRLALEALARKNEKLVYSRVIKYRKIYNHKLEDEDLFQYGMIGLIIAAGKFESHKDAKFSTYAIWWIDQQIRRSIVDYGFIIRIPVHYFEQVSKLMRLFRNNPGLTKEDIYLLVEDEGMSREKFEELLLISENIMSLKSLNSFVGEDEESELGDFLEDRESLSVEDEVEFKLLQDTFAHVLETLTPREKDILEQRFGLIDGVAKTLEQVGIKYQVTRERIRQIEAKALRKLRHPSRAKDLKQFYN